MTMKGRKVGRPRKNSSPPKAKNSSKITVGKDLGWEPAKPLEVKGKNPSKTYHWLYKKVLDTRLAQGWELTDRESIGYQPVEGAPTPIDSHVHCNELILGEMSNEKAKARNAYFQRMADDMEGSQKETLEREVGQGIYGKIERRRG